MEALPLVKEAGFDVVTRSPSQESIHDYLKAAHAAEMKVLLSSGAFGSNRFATSQRIDAFDAHPATWGWYLIDEPDLHDVPPDRVRAVTRDFQQRARKPGVVVLASGNAAKIYGGDCDLLMVDFYPIPWAPVSRFAKEMRLADYARGDKPYAAVVQAFDWAHFSDVLGQTNQLRAPTIAELRCMSYMALAQDAKALFFYTYMARTWNLAESPLWPELRQLVRELRANSALFQNAPLWYPSEVEYADPSAMYNEVQDGVMLARLYHMEKANGDLKPGYYFVMINTTDREVGYAFKLPFHDSRLRQVGAAQPDEIALEDAWLRRTYGPYEVSIFGPLQDRAF